MLSLVEKNQIKGGFIMSFCSSCGANVNDADRFCSKCGKPIAITTPQPRIQMQPQTIRSNEVQYSIKEIRQKHRLEYKKMTFEEKCKTAKGAFGLNLFCAVCWSFVAIMNYIDFDPGKKSDIFLLVLDTFLAVFYLVSSLISYRKMINEKDENKSNSVIV
jgi:hypothetical protein